MAKVKSFLLKISDAFSGLKDYLGDANVLFIVLLIIIVLILTINYIYKKNKTLNYLPGIISLIAGLIILILNIGDLMSPFNLAKLEMTIVLLTAGLCGIVFAKLLSVIKKSNKRIKNSKKKEKATE
ncbi:hypothetical protein E8P77_10955 [Soehngenia saccharolytica]|nr:hypothetical protein E8P77_10955 [Soehngenia saccharolytica]